MSLSFQAVFSSINCTSCRLLLPAAIIAPNCNRCYRPTLLCSLNLEVKCKWCDVMQCNIFATDRLETQCKTEPHAVPCVGSGPV